MTDEQLSALLRLKRYEGPPPEYFEGLLTQVHRRQRAELLHRPLWRIAVERVQTFFSEHSMGNLSYAGAMASALVVGVGTIFFMTPGGSLESRRSGVVASASAESEKLPPIGESLTLPISAPPTLPASFQGQPNAAARVTSAKDRRYVIDAMPVNYEPEASTRF